MPCLGWQYNFSPVCLGMDRKKLRRNDGGTKDLIRCWWCYALVVWVCPAVWRRVVDVLQVQSGKSWVGLVLSFECGHFGWFEWDFVDWFWGGHFLREEMVAWCMLLFFYFDSKAFSRCDMLFNYQTLEANLVWRCTWADWVVEIIMWMLYFVGLKPPTIIPFFGEDFWPFRSWAKKHGHDQLRQVREMNAVFSQEDHWQNCDRWPCGGVVGWRVIAWLTSGSRYIYIWMFPKIGVPQNEWFTMENPMYKWMIWGVYPMIFGSPPIFRVGK